MNHKELPNGDTYDGTIPGWRFVLTVDHGPSGDTLTLFCLAEEQNEVAMDPRPSLLGIEGFDDLWGDGDYLAYAVPPERTRALIHALEQRQFRPPVAASPPRPETYWG